jgi:chromosome segregation protein
VKFERLRLVGFKTFVDPTEIVIEPGLTGIVGPNGCGKSNLVEALRWVMGETSSKSLRGTGMEDVIFSGSARRPERNMAEVSIRIGEPPVDLGGHLSGAQSLEISRKIERDSGSAYKINGREARARDIQMLFADAASGARSPSMVRQGQIGEIIAAKPQLRRRILEDAAGIAGLHARRHEAELRLRQAEDNLARAEDVLIAIDSQILELKRQARQAERYKGLAAQIRLLEIAQLHRLHQEAMVEAEAARIAREAALRENADCLVIQGQTERARAVAAHEIEALREAAIRAAAALQHKIVLRETLDGDLKRAEDKIREISTRQSELVQDQARAQQIVIDAQEASARLDAERQTQSGALEAAKTERDGAKQAFTSVEAELASQEAEFMAAQSQQAEAQAEAKAQDQRLSEAKLREARLLAALNNARREYASFEAADTLLQSVEALQAAFDSGQIAREAADQAAFERDQAALRARQEEQTNRPKLAEAERLFQRLETEAQTIRKMVAMVEPGFWRRAMDAISVEKGYEAALGAALGDDLEAGLEASAPRYWHENTALSEIPPLPAGVIALANVTRAPEALAHRLASIGVVAREQGGSLQGALHPGQRLVSIEGDLWRWDGFIVKAGAPNPAAKRLIERNRLSEIEAQAQAARQSRDAARTLTEALMKAQRAADEAASAAREGAQQKRRQQEALQHRLTQMIRQSEAQRGKAMALTQQIGALEADMDEARAHVERLEVQMATRAPLALDGSILLALRERVSGARDALSKAQTRQVEIESRIQSSAQRLDAISHEEQAWQKRIQNALQHADAGVARLNKLDADFGEAMGLPAQIGAERRRIGAEIESLQVEAREAEDLKAQGETRLRLCDEAARIAANAFAQARENGARLEVAAEHAAEKRIKSALVLEEKAEKPAQDVAAMLAEHPALANLTLNEIEQRLTDLKADRERLGAVNLRASLELGENEASRMALAGERDEIAEAIRRFRTAITALNSEGRARLRVAFERVDAHFSKLFERLFGGGSAQLQLVEADDPLEAGLEILAKPPGKKPQHLTLLSGGEQALTAIALIFAVFLTNPSPICVLDEVDAPLDDANVERLCDLLSQMAQETSTRFLVITHHPISMARMDRLFGVTMVEQGISQLVSVDLKNAERILASL